MNPRLAFIAAPLLVLVYGIIRILDGLDGSRGPGLAWTTGHLAFLAAMALFVPIFWEMRRMAGRNVLATVSTGAGFAGILAVSAQFTVDLVVGFLSADHAEMGVLFDRIQAVPGVSIAIYDGGPYLFYLGQLALVVQLAVIGRVKAWTPLLVLLDLVLPIVDRDLIPVGAIFLLVSFVPLARQITATAEPVTTRSAEPVTTRA